MEPLLLTIKDRLWIVLLALSIATSFLWLSYPQQVVFDEVHFGKFVTSYCCSKERFFDIHPPHAKLLIAAGAYMGGYRGGVSFEHIGQPYGDVPVLALRFVPALAGALIPLLAFALLRQARVSAPVAFLGGLAFVLDNAFTVQSRIISLDTILLAATLGSLSAFLAAQRSIHNRALYLAAAGGLAGLAAGVKFTGLAALVTLGVIVLYCLFVSRTRSEARDQIKQGLYILAWALGVYIIGWMMHFSLLTQPGPGDVWGVPTGHFVQDTIELHKKMFQANYNLGATHPYGSKWWEWPIMKRPIFYWQDGDARIYFIGNPAVWWGGSILFLAAVVATFSAFRRRYKTLFQSSHRAGLVFLLGYVVSFMPFIQVPRVLFLYHYMTPLAFSLLFGFWWLDKEGIRKRYGWYWYGTAVLLITGGFILFSPFTYGIPAPQWSSMLYWFPSWR